MYNNKHNSEGFTIIELIVAIILIALFWFGLRFGIKFVVEFFPDYKNESWFAIIGFIGAFIGGIIPVAIFIGSCYCIGMLLEKHKKRENSSRRRRQNVVAPAAEAGE